MPVNLQTAKRSAIKTIFVIFYGMVLINFCLVRTAQSDELMDLKQQLESMQEEKQALDMKIEETQKRIRVLEKADLPTGQAGTETQKESAEKISSTASPKSSAKSETALKSDVSVKYYWDTREYNTFEIVTGLTGLPLGLAFWGFTDLHGNQDAIDDSFDFNRFFMEYRLSRHINPDYAFGIEGLGTQMEYNDSNGTGNQLVRFGLTYKHDIPSLTDKKGWLTWRAFPYESDGSGQQISWLFFFPFTQRIFLSGFVDLNLIEGGKDQWVIEPQLNFKLTDRVNFLVEYRYSGFEAASAALDGEGVALGMDVKF